MALGKSKRPEVIWTNGGVRALLRSVRTPHRLESNPVGSALLRSTAAPCARDALLQTVRKALAEHDPRLLELVYRCDFAGERTKNVADAMHISPRQFFRYRALAVEAIGSLIDRTLASQEASLNARGSESETIVRRWHGRVPLDKSDEYMQLLRAVSIPDYRRVPGNLGAYVLRRDTEHVAHFETLSVWVCETAIEQYAGEHIRRPKYYDFDREYLLEFEQWVTHFRSAYDLERPRTF